ncbi:TatD family hydrolase [Paenilisteria rocourtiae]|uniref:TatD DNase family protein n=1 Tax=Listeria rocourtiae TaxID=647910 RepID=A0A4R6ZF94_9LIST|nr:TatD family hydrolase [Listeria rocourtiae]MBC1435253.1 TatD family hydrolase [Listeria rocourtiae]MBC1606066.1 TatD family hydrolase [Listeria rocourtiae]TDR50810.1 TatD DNase family protein [Listeria rocourtiae]
MLFDTHVHLNDDAFNEDLEEVIARAKENDVSRMAVVGFNEETINRALKLADKYDFIYLIVGWHPTDAITFTEEKLEWLRELSKNPKVIALGEMGLDYHWDTSPKETQFEVFRQQIRLAKEVKLPIVIHNREATEDVVRILQEEKASEVGGIMHCFGETIEVMEACLAMNFYISFGGTVTFKNAKLPKIAVESVPLDKILIETDAPYLAPHPNRGKRNEPSYVKIVAEKVAELKKMKYEEIARYTTENANRLFKLT